MFLQGGNLGEREGERVRREKEGKSFVVSGTSENTIGSLHVVIHVLPTIPENLNCELFYKKNVKNPVTYLEIKFLLRFDLIFSIFFLKIFQF